MVTTVVSGVPTVTVGFIGPRLTEKVWFPSTLISCNIVTVMHPGISGPNGKLASALAGLKSVLSTARNDKYSHKHVCKY